MATDMVMAMAIAMMTEEKMNKNQPYQYALDQEDIDISRIIDNMWKGLKRFGWLFLVIISIFSSVMYYYSKTTYTPQYTAYSTFTVKSVNVYKYNESNYNAAVASQVGAVFPYILTNDILKAQVAEDLGTNNVPGTVTAQALKDTNMITLTVVASEAQLAYDILQSVIRNYPLVGSYIIGDVELNLLGESGVPEASSNPLDLKQKALQGSLAGILLSVIILLLYAVTRTTISSEDDLKKAFNITCLGAVPRVRFKERRKDPITDKRVLFDVRGIPQYFVESIRTLRTRVEKACEEEGINTLLVSSAIPGEGKTTVATNLALSLSRKEKRVVVIDGDFRNPSIAKQMALTDASGGIIEYLTGKATLKDVLIPYHGSHHLFLIPGISRNNNPTELLNSRKMRDLISTLKEEFDYVIVDTPPSAVVSDSSTVARYVEGGIFVVRQDYANLEVLQDGMEMYSGTGIHMLGSVLNNTTASIVGSGYGYGNYGYGRYGYGDRYGYGYGYGYGDSKEQGSEQA